MEFWWRVEFSCVPLWCFCGKWHVSQKVNTLQWESIDFIGNHWFIRIQRIWLGIRAYQSQDFFLVSSKFHTTTSKTMPGVPGAERLNCQSQNNSPKANEHKYAFQIFTDLTTCSPHSSLLRPSKPCVPSGVPDRVSCARRAVAESQTWDFADLWKNIFAEKFKKYPKCRKHHFQSFWTGHGLGTSRKRLKTPKMGC